MVKKYSLDNKKFLIFVSLMFLLVFVLVAGGSYAFFTTSVKGKEFAIYTGNLKVDYSKKTDTISIDNLYPMTDTEGLKQMSHEFTVTNKGNIDARYQVRLELDDTKSDMVDIRYIKMSYQVNGGDYSEPVLLSDLNSSLVFTKNIIVKPNESNTYGIKLWIDLSASNDIQGKEFKARVVVDSIQNVDDSYQVDTIPIIYLNKDSNGNQDIHLKVGETYQELGVEKVEDDQDIFTSKDVVISYEYYDGTNINTVANIDTSKVGIYYVNYSVTDRSNQVGKKTRVVTVNNSSSVPKIILNGDSFITQEEMESYNELGVTVEDNNQVVTIGEVKTSTIGTYVVRYIVIDSNGNLNSVVRTVNIIKSTSLYNKILSENTLIEKEPTLTTSSNNSSDESGLYSSTNTNSGEATYYFRGNVENNYVSFVGFTWRIVRINEDKTIRIIMQDGINNNASIVFNSNYNNYTYMYYTNSQVKTQLESWYHTNIGSKKDLAKNVASGAYYCEQAKAKRDSSWTSGNANMTLYSSYTPDFKCSSDGNNKGVVSANVGLLTYDEVAYAGGYFNQANNNYYLYNSAIYWWTMSPTGCAYGRSSVWTVYTTGYIHSSISDDARTVRPVINIKSDTQVIGNGTKENPYVVA